MANKIGFTMKGNKLALRPDNGKLVTLIDNLGACEVGMQKIKYLEKLPYLRKYILRGC